MHAQSLGSWEYGSALQISGFCIWEFNPPQMETIKKKKIEKVPQSKTWICQAGNYLHSIYSYLGSFCSRSNPEMI